MCFGPLSGGELSILLRGSTIRSSAVRELVMEICSADTLDMGYKWMRRDDARVCAYEMMSESTTGGRCSQNLL